MTAEPNATVLATMVEAAVLRAYGPWVRASQLPALFASWDLALRARQAGWLTPIVRGHSRAIYRLADVLACLRRIEAGEEVPPRRKMGRTKMQARQR